MITTPTHQGQSGESGLAAGHTQNNSASLELGWLETK